MEIEKDEPTAAEVAEEERKAAIARGDIVDDDENGFINDMHGWDFFSGDNDPSDEHGHGTHTAGTIAAVRNNDPDPANDPDPGKGSTGLLARRQEDR